MEDEEVETTSVSSTEARIWVETLAALVGDDPSATADRLVPEGGDLPNIAAVLSYASEHRSVIAQRLRPENIGQLSATQRAALERFLEYLEYVEDLSAEQAVRDEQLRRALTEYNEDFDGDPVGNFIQEFILFFARLFGLEDKARGLFDVAEPAPESAPFTPAPRFDATAILGEQNSIPRGGVDGHYRLMTVARNSGAGILSAEMVLVAPDGSVAARYDMRSGGAGRGSLPGLDDVDASRADSPVTAEYRINWNDVRINRRERAMRYSDGTLGYSFTLENSSNIAAIGGAGRNYFRIHPQGTGGAGTAGCLEFSDDAAARHFYQMMMSLPENQRPQSLEVLNARNLEPATSRMAFAQVDGIDDIGGPNLSSLTAAAASLVRTLSPISALG
ncbi:MAG: hypothetical protein J0M34_02195 [Alphaproteobacteria bacterium]|nr:hypothetical protein [Alphaproteobacteria bacterium]